MKVLDEVIENIINTLLEMFDQTITAHKKAIEALIQADNKKALMVLENDSHINHLEEQISYDVMIAIAKYQPVASDLRKLIGVIKIANDLERVADYAKTISKTAIVNCNQTFLSELFLKNSLKMSKIITRLLKESKEAFITTDIDKAYNVIQKEIELDKLLKETIKSNPFCEIKEENVESFMLLMGVLRNLERSKGHVANICESVIFAENGKFIEL